MREVFGARGPVATPAQYRPHCSLVYCQSALSEEGLGSWLLSAAPIGCQFRPEPVEIIADRVTIAVQDTFATGGHGRRSPSPWPRAH
jgi:hypothetical protein